VVKVADFLKGELTDLMLKTTSKTNLPSSNVMQFTLDNGLKFTARPSGTEPKIKFYFSVQKSASTLAEIRHQESEMNKMIEAVSQTRQFVNDS